MIVTFVTRESDTEAVARLSNWILYCGPSVPSALQAACFAAHVISTPVLSKGMILERFDAEIIISICSINTNLSGLAFLDTGVMKQTQETG